MPNKIRAVDKKVNTIEVSLREYIDDKFNSLDVLVGEKFKALSLAMEKAEVATTARIEHLTEFRNNMRDQESTFLTRTEYEQAHRFLCDKIDAITKYVLLGVGAALTLEVIFRFVFR